MGLFDLVREEQEAKKKAEESAKEDVKDTVVKEVKKVEEAPKEADQQPAPVAKAEKQAADKYAHLLKLQELYGNEAE